MDEYEFDAEHLDELIVAAKAAFADEGVLVSMRKQILSLTASADGGAWMVIAIALPSGTLAWFGQQIAKSLDSHVRAAISRLRKSSVGDLMVHADDVRVLIEPDLPDDAILQLVDPLPDAPSGELQYDRILGVWVDSEQRATGG